MKVGDRVWFVGKAYDMIEHPDRVQWTSHCNINGWFTVEHMGRVRSPARHEKVPLTVLHGHGLKYVAVIGSHAQFYVMPEDLTETLAMARSQAAASIRQCITGNEEDLVHRINAILGNTL